MIGDNENTEILENVKKDIVKLLETKSFCNNMAYDIKEHKNLNDSMTYDVQSDSAWKFMETTISKDATSDAEQQWNRSQNLNKR